MKRKQKEKGETAPELKSDNLLNQTGREIVEALISEARRYDSPEAFVEAQLQEDLAHLSNNWYQRKKREQGLAPVADFRLPPGDTVKIYRSTARTLIAPGDVVDTYREYVESYLEDKPGSKLLSMEVPKGDLRANDTGDLIYAPYGITSLEAISEISRGLREFTFEQSAHPGKSLKDERDQLIASTAKNSIETQASEHGEVIDGIAASRKGRETPAFSRIAEFDRIAKSISEQKGYSPKAKKAESEIQTEHEYGTDGILLSEDPYGEMQIMGFIPELEKDDDGLDLER